MAGKRKVDDEGAVTVEGAKRLIRDGTLSRLQFKLSDAVICQQRSQTARAVDHLKLSELFSRLVRGFVSQVRWTRLWRSRRDTLPHSYSLSLSLSNTHTHTQSHAIIDIKINRPLDG